MNRRDFIRNSAAAGLVTAFPLAAEAAKKKKNSSVEALQNLHSTMRSSVSTSDLMASLKSCSSQIHITSLVTSVQSVP